MDWAVGDLAECVFSGRWVSETGSAGAGPEPGDCHRVATVEYLTWSGERVLVLGFTCFDGLRFIAGHFRRLLPRADVARAADAAFIARLRTMRQPEPM